MARLFAEAFTVPLLEPDSPEPELRYDEDRCLNVLPDGRAFIETGLTCGGSDTLTEVRAEQDDFDRDHAGQNLERLGTVTKIQRESDDYESRLLMLATETRMPRESDDFARGDLEPWAGTNTAVRAESDDFASEHGSPYRRDAASVRD